MSDVWSSPPVVGTLALVVALLLYWLGGALATRGHPQPGKHLPYTGGEPHIPLPDNLDYHAFYRLALLFGILHVATLVISTLPPGATSHRAAALYLSAAAVSVLVLTGKED
jgi:NADH:ubiquinone oxidoreductase subunit 3 (subunit A)